MEHLTIFNNEEFGQIRAIAIDGEPWFVGKDVAERLGYTDTNQSIRYHVDEEDKLTRKFDGSGQSRNMTIINESGLYSLIIGSKLPAAKRFKHWVTHDVIPSIRQHGIYATDGFLEKTLADPAYAIGVLQALQEEREKVRLLGEEVAAGQRVIEEMRPKVTYYDNILSSNNTLSTTQIAKDYGMSPQELNRILNELGIQYKVNKQWVLYAKYQGYGYTDSATKTNSMGYTYMQTRWTQKGRLFLYEALKAAGYIPLIERGEVA